MCNLTHTDDSCLDPTVTDTPSVVANNGGNSAGTFNYFCVSAIINTEQTKLDISLCRKIYLIS